MGTTTDTRHTRPPTEMAKEPAIADFAFSSRHPPPPYISRLSAKTAFRLVPTIVSGKVATTLVRLYYVQPEVGRDFVIGPVKYSQFQVGMMRREDILKYVNSM